MKYLYMPNMYKYLKHVKFENKKIHPLKEIGTNQCFFAVMATAAAVSFPRVWGV